MPRKLAQGSFALQTPVGIREAAAVAGKKEGDGPLGESFDEIFEDTTLGAESWELAEVELQRAAVRHLLQKAEIEPAELDLFFAGDLQNQCTASGYHARSLSAPMAGLYHACATMAEGVALSALLTDGGGIQTVMALASSHFCSVERQYRFPLNYGSVRPYSAQNTATAAGAALIGKAGGAPYITAVTIGRVRDMGVTDLNNMGAAMAPAAMDTILRHLSARGSKPADYDLILTGDLGRVGMELLRTLCKDAGCDVSKVINDCGLLLYDRVNQDVHAGGSGAGCSAGVLCGHLFRAFRQQKLRRVLFLSTGALLSPAMVQQGESIPAVAHLIELSAEPEVV